MGMLQSTLGVSAPSERAVARPASDSSPVTVGAGLLAVAFTWWLCGPWAISPLYTLALFVGVPALAMIVVDVAVVRVHRRASTGLDFSRFCRGETTLSRVAIKVLSFYVVWAGIALVYWLLKEYAPYRSGYMLTLAIGLATAAAVLTPVYVALVDRLQVDPHDEAWHFGQWLLGRPHDAHLARIHVLATGLRAFFLPFLLGSISELYLNSEAIGFAEASQSAHRMLYYYLDKLWLLDSIFSSIGYLIASRLLDTHIRDVYRRPTSWLVTCVCYAPYNTVFFTGTGFYQVRYWDSVMAVDGLAGLVWMTLIAITCTIYVGANISFGLRFANLSKRGIITTGPYALMKHPAYFFKNISWWLMYVPFAVIGSPLEAVRASLLMALASGVYYLRARHEEIELAADPKYQDYCEYIRRHGLLARLRRAGRGWRAGNGDTISGKEIESVVGPYLEEAHALLKRKDSIRTEAESLEEARQRPDADLADIKER
ncbi:isoprenylcysteine carboxylmethyltransferase family protein [Pseudaminobacter soli (ex Li et al. 2025)]|uniref:Isoprenylcysteine carboxyl methyltransferase n=1 Tax=Pseudaminobacter soli (ex Li et al. 2025) TaxID=1295366 RepID=A0A2P7S596_9HYPH|nr:isoprenylcysteine carboxylmethyltransferase family protein [Mesorhizobium soli]PSJ57633.1 hypothetical protein C7I85_21995 [Mesorhizobium soli]